MLYGGENYDEFQGHLQNITAFDEFCRMSQEELRARDYGLITPAPALKYSPKFF